MSEVQANLRTVYQIRQRNDIRTLHTQRGAETQLSFQVTEALQFFAAAQLHQAAFPLTKFDTLKQSITDMALALRGPSHLHNIFNVSARTIQHRALEYGLVQPGMPVYTDTPQPDGSVSRIYTSTSNYILPSQGRPNYCYSSLMCSSSMIELAAQLKITQSSGSQGINWQSKLSRQEAEAPLMHY
ncbi:hypothetical protein C8R44DRAFT_734882 [Mycena epipterygia]|nr:hypothetical protein C8R44DRAFT_734882 [Mycena epipterygia]